MTNRNVPASVRSKLLNMARENKRPFNEILQYFAMERFLYRLSISQHAQKFVLKGALMFTAWKFLAHRPTMDIDMLAKTANNVDHLIAIIQEVCLIEPDIDDGILFNSHSVSGKTSQINAEYSGVQLKFNGELNKARVRMKVDVGFGDIVFPSPPLITFPTILPFPSPKIRGYTPSTVIAEKFQTILFRGIDNSRMKDFYDIWILQQKMKFKGNNLHEAIRKTFLNRDTIIDREALDKLRLLGESEEKAKHWKQFIKKNQFSEQTPDFQFVVSAISQFLKPIILVADNKAKLSTEWDPLRGWSQQ